MRVATYAKGGGRAVAFSLAAFRQVFAGGRELGDEGTVLIAAAACEMHPTAVLKGAALRSVGASLERAGERARQAGVSALPAIEVAGQTFCGEQALERATEALATAARTGGCSEPSTPTMKANRVFHLIVTRGGREPAFMADRRRAGPHRGRVVDDGELLLYWELAAQGRHQARAQAPGRPRRAGGRGVPGHLGGRRRVDG